MERWQVFPGTSSKQSHRRRGSIGRQQSHVAGVTVGWIQRSQSELMITQLVKLSLLQFQAAHFLILKEQLQSTWTLFNNTTGNNNPVLSLNPAEVNKNNIYIYICCFCLRQYIYIFTDVGCVWYNCMYSYFITYIYRPIYICNKIWIHTIISNTSYVSKYIYILT